MSVTQELTATGVPTLFCPCGRLPVAGGLCRGCYGAAWRSLRRFGGYRERVLARDRRCCRVCGGAGPLCVHHRRPGRNEPRSLVAVCRACHARLHRRHQLPGWAPPLLTTLWEEQHRGWPVQLPLAFELSAAGAAA